MNLGEAHHQERRFVELIIATLFLSLIHSMTISNRFLKLPCADVRQAGENTFEGGGHSLFLGGAALVKALREENPEAFEVLASHNIPLFYHHDGWDYRAHQRVIELDARGNVASATLPQHLQVDIDLPQDPLDDYYSALRSGGKPAQRSIYRDPCAGTLNSSRLDGKGRASN